MSPPTGAAAPAKNPALRRSLAGDGNPIGGAAASVKKQPAACVSRRREADLPEDCGAEQAVRVAQRFGQFHVAVIVADDQLDRLAHGFDGGGEVAGLALEFGGFSPGP
jgi:hypothetical protein